MTFPLYHKDPYLTVFTSKIVKKSYSDGITTLILDQTCFYPLSGGQPSDIGTINGQPVIRVEKKGNDIEHHIEGEIIGSGVSGIVDWKTRKDHMQQHTGQHILSQSIFRKLDVDTDSLHIGRKISSVDIPIDVIGYEDLIQIEEDANEIVFSNTKISTYIVESTDDDSYRKKSNIKGNIRIVDIENYDKTPCGGTHFSSAGEVGMIHIVNAYKKGKKWRIEFVCGKRCLDLIRAYGDIIKNVSEEMMVPKEDIIEKIRSYKEKTASLNKEMADVREKLAKSYVESHISKKSDTPHIVTEIMDDELIAKRIAQLCSEKDNVICLMGVNSTDAAMLIFSASKNTELNVSSILKDCISLIKGRGGGNQFFATGKGTNISGLEEALCCAKNKIQEMLISDGKK